MILYLIQDYTREKSVKTSSYENKTDGVYGSFGITFRIDYNRWLVFKLKKEIRFKKISFAFLKSKVIIKFDEKYLLNILTYPLIDFSKELGFYGEIYDISYDEDEDTDTYYAEKDVYNDEVEALMEEVEEEFNFQKLKEQESFYRAKELLTWFTK